MDVIMTKPVKPPIANHVQVRFCSRPRPAAVIRSARPEFEAFFLEFRWEVFSAPCQLVGPQT